MLSALQKKTCKAIVHIFETGSPHGDYTRVTSHPSDPGGLTYGTSQTTLMSGNLHLLLEAYCNAPGARFANEISPYRDYLREKDESLNTDSALHGILREAGNDSVMRTTQDTFFDERFWSPAEKRARSLSIETALGQAVIYDSQIHGSLVRTIRKTKDDCGTVAEVGEAAWIERYVRIRKDWLETHRNRLLRRTVYRMDAFLALIDASVWNLELPLTIRSFVLDEDTLLHPPRDEHPPVVTLRRGMKGERVRALQKALVSLGESLVVDGDFGPATEAALRRVQQSHGLIADGIVGPVTYAAYREWIT